MKTTRLTLQDKGKIIVARTKALPGIVKSVINSYVVDRLRNEKIQNDMGASFTKLERRRDRIIKRAENKGEKKLREEIEWNLLFRRKSFGKYLPTIYDYSLEPGNVYYEMKYYTFPNLRKIIVEDMNTFSFLEVRWKIILKILFRKLYIRANEHKPEENFFSLHHYTKYSKRMEETKKEAPFLQPIINAEQLYINGVRKIGPNYILKAVLSRDDIVRRLTPPKLYIAHGDLHCNNILCGVAAGNFILLDARGKSPAGTLYFDPAYDIAKLYHDLHSFYSLIEKHLFDLEHTHHGKEIHLNYAFTDSLLTEKFTRHYFLVRKIIEDQYQHGEFKNINYRADFIEAMLYLTMIPLHLRHHKEATVCLATGVVRLNQWLKNYHPDLHRSLFSSRTPVEEECMQ